MKLESPGGLIATLYARGLLDYLRANGIEPNVLYPKERVHAFDVAVGHTEIPINEWVRMFDIAVAVTNDPELPAKAGARLSLKHLGVLGHVLMHCTTLEELIQQLARYIRLLGQIGQPRLEIRTGWAHLLWIWPHYSIPPPALAQFMLAARATFLRWFANRPDMQFDACFHFDRPRTTSACSKIFGGELHFNHEQSELVFPESYLRYPVVSADENFRQQVQAQAQALLNRISNEPDIAQRLKSAILPKLAIGKISLDDAARTLNLSARTLQRQLSRHRLSFQKVLDDIRRMQAESYLKNTDVSLIQIAFLLGYTEQSTFQAAFKRWTKGSPGKFRRGMLLN